MPRRQSDRLVISNRITEIITQIGDIVPRPSWQMDRVFASRLCPDRIMHPQPVSDEKPVWSPRVLRRMAKDKAAEAFGSVDLGMGSNPDR